MPTFTLLAKVDQIVTKVVELDVTAATEDEAVQNARLALAEYPKPIQHDGALGVQRILALKSTHWIPKSIEIEVKRARVA